MDTIIQQTVNALSLGGTYALLALGLAIFATVPAGATCAGNQEARCFSTSLRTAERKVRPAIAPSTAPTIASSPPCPCNVAASTAPQIAPQMITVSLLFQCLGV